MGPPCRGACASGDEAHNFGLLHRRALIVFVLAAPAVFAVAGCGGGGRPSFAQLQWSDDDPAWAPSGREVFFDSNRAGTRAERNTDEGYSVYAMRIDGGGLRRLTRGDACNDQYPDPSPNDQAIAFIRTCQTGDLWVVARGGGRSKMLTTRVEEAAWSSDGRLLAVTRDRNALDPFSGSDLWVVATRDGQMRLLARGVGMEKSIGGFAWSRDGRRLAFGCRGGSLCVADVRTGTVGRLHRFKRGDDVSWVAWSPDDKQLAFVDGNGGSYDPNYSAWVMAADGKHARQLPRYGEGNIWDVEWLPGRPQVLLVNTDYGKAYLVRADGTHKHDLPFEVDDITASPDGKAVLLVQRVFDSEGTYDHSTISLANLKTGHVRQLTQLP